jgi:hypothetical protein
MLNLEDIISARTMDSVQLSKFCYEKGFELNKVDKDYWTSVHKYHVVTNSSISLERTFPKARKLLSQDTTSSDNGMVYFRYTDQELLKEFKQKIKEKGFKFKRTDRKDYRGNTFTHNIYLIRDFEIDLASEKLIGQKMKYTLIYYKRMN